MPKCRICGKFSLFNIDKAALICKKCNNKNDRLEKGDSLNEVSLSFPDNGIEPYVSDPFANIPKEIIDLLWFLDGTRKNFIPKIYDFQKPLTGKKYKLPFHPRLA